MCIVRSPVARIWLAGLGQDCDASARGAAYISRASAGDNGITANSRAPQYIYAPANAAAVRAFYATCAATCAVGDTLSSDGVHCLVRHEDAPDFLCMYLCTYIYGTYYIDLVPYVCMLRI